MTATIKSVTAVRALSDERFEEFFRTDRGVCRKSAARRAVPGRSGSEVGAELGSPLFEFGQFCPQAPDLAVDVLQLCPGLLLADVPVAVAGPGECLDFAAEQSQPRVPVHRGLAVLQRARVYRVMDLVLGQPELALASAIQRYWRARLRVTRRRRTGPALAP